MKRFRTIEARFYTNASKKEIVTKMALPMQKEDELDGENIKIKGLFGFPLSAAVLDIPIQSLCLDKMGKPGSWFVIPDGFTIQDVESNNIPETFHKRTNDQIKSSLVSASDWINLNRNETASFGGFVPLYVDYNDEDLYEENEDIDKLSDFVWLVEGAYLSIPCALVNDASNEKISSYFI